MCERVLLEAGYLRLAPSFVGCWLLSLNSTFNTNKIILHLQGNKLLLHQVTRHLDCSRHLGCGCWDTYNVSVTHRQSRHRSWADVVTHQAGRQVQNQVYQTLPLYNTHHSITSLTSAATYNHMPVYFYMPSERQQAVQVNKLFIPDLHLLDGATWNIKHNIVVISFGHEAKTLTLPCNTGLGLNFMASASRPKFWPRPHNTGLSLHPGLITLVSAYIPAS